MRHPEQATILMYHDVRDPDQTQFPRRYEGTSFLNVAEFAQQLDFIESNYTVVSLRDLQRQRAAGEVTSGAAVLTFDDGLTDHFERVRPELLRRGLPATFFIPTAPVFERVMIPSNKIQFILAAALEQRQVVEEVFNEIDRLRGEFPAIPSNAELWETFSTSLWANNVWTPEEVFVTRLLRSGLEPAQARARVLDALFARLVEADERVFAEDFYLSADQAAALHRDGFEIGSHGHSSAPLTVLSDDEMQRDLALSASLIERNIFAGGGNGGLSISYPNGAVDDAVTSAAEACGFGTGLTTQAVMATAAHSDLLLPRFNAPAVFPPKASL